MEPRWFGDRFGLVAGWQLCCKEGHIVQNPIFHKRLSSNGDSICLRACPSSARNVIQQFDQEANHCVAIPPMLDATYDDDSFSGCQRWAELIVCASFTTVVAIPVVLALNLMIRIVLDTTGIIAIALYKRTSSALCFTYCDVLPVLMRAGLILDIGGQR